MPNFENLHSITTLRINDQVVMNLVLRLRPSSPAMHRFGLRVQVPGFSGALPDTIGYAGWFRATDTHYLTSLEV